MAAGAQTADGDRVKAPTAETAQGRVRGTREPGVCAFHGLPFAEPPVGPFRFQPPQPPTPWTGVRDATRFAPAAPQPAIPEPFIIPLAAWDLRAPTSEDCLYLNVWTPAVDNARRPVLVWIHGGSLLYGAGSQAWYDGATLARSCDAVVVTANYRLGPLGWLYLEGPDGTPLVEPNLGLRDQVSALEWVRANIGAFGGDPEAVTVAGQSAGGKSVGALLAAPRARGLFRAAVPLSGALHSDSREHAARLGAELLTELEVDFAGLKETPASDIATAALAVFARMSRNPRWPTTLFAPVMDADVMSAPPLDAVAAGHADDVALLAGTTETETKLVPIADGSPLHAAVHEDLPSAVGRALDLPADAAQDLVAGYERIRSEQGLPVDPVELFHALEADQLYGLPAMQLAEAHAPRPQPTFRSLFDWLSPDSRLGSCHTLDLGFLFGTFGLPGMDRFAGAGPDADVLGRRMLDVCRGLLWNGRPGSADLPDWPEFEPSGRATMMLGSGRVEPGPHDDELQLLLDVQRACGRV